MSKKSRAQADVIADALQDAGFEAIATTGQSMRSLVLIDDGKTARLRVEDDGRIVIEHEYEPDTVSFMLRKARLDPFTKKRSKTWRVWSLDVWGNEEDGFTVNNRSDAGEIEIPDEATEADVVKALRDGNYLKRGVKASSIQITGDEYAMSIDDAKTGWPLYQLETR